MRKLTLFAVIVCLVLCCGMNAFGQQHEFIGASPGLYSGANHGRTGMNRVCQLSWGVYAHMCTVDEFFSLTGNYLGTAGEQLWVQPELKNCVWDGSQIACQEEGASGSVPDSNLYLTCDAWTSASGLAATSVVYSTAAGWTLVTGGDCSAKRRVACCE